MIEVKIAIYRESKVSLSIDMTLQMCILLNPHSLLIKPDFLPTETNATPPLKSPVEEKWWE
jgi:hypothetical protein